MCHYILFFGLLLCYIIWYVKCFVIVFVLNGDASSSLYVTMHILYARRQQKQTWIWICFRSYCDISYTLARCFVGSFGGLPLPFVANFQDKSPVLCPIACARYVTGNQCRRIMTVGRVQHTTIADRKWSLKCNKSGFGGWKLYPRAVINVFFFFCTKTIHAVAL